MPTSELRLRGQEELPRGADFSRISWVSTTCLPFTGTTVTTPALFVVV